MRSVSVGLADHLARGDLTIATCWRVTLSNGSVRTFTDHDRPLLINRETYLASSGYKRTDIQTSAALNVDNLEVGGMLVSPSITEADLLAGIWDNAQIEVFQVNWNNLSQGRVYQRVGKIGEVTLTRGSFVTELRGLMQAYTIGIGEVRTPSCRANLGDARCKVNLAGGSPSFTQTGIIEGVNPDGVTFYDSARTETGPINSVDITDITNANPGVVSLFDAALSLAPGDPVVLSGIVGPERLNTVTTARNPTATSFELGVDTSDTTDYPPYISGGTVTLMGSTAGWFDYGKVTFDADPMLGGLNAGLSQDVKNSLPGQWTLQLPMPYAVHEGDVYTIVAGCDKSFPTCKAKFNNVLNNRSEPWLPGIDKVIQIARRGG